MSLKLKSRQFIKELSYRNFLLLLLLTLVLIITSVAWNNYDFQILDYFYTKSVVANDSIKRDERIVYLNITRDSYKSFNVNYLRRDKLAEINRALTEFNPNAIMYDIIFAHSSNRNDDSLFNESLLDAENVYLPVGFSLSPNRKYFRWGDDPFSHLLSKVYLKPLKQFSEAKPLYAEWVEAQSENFINSVKNTGHINAIADPDGVYRRLNLIIKVDSLFFPAISLSMFLDYVRVPFDSVEVHWGDYLLIPKLETSFMDSEMRIPIDKNGTVFIPFANEWKNSIKMMEVQSLLTFIEDDEYYNSLYNYYEGAFIFISDISVGTSDLGQTPLEPDAPLVVLHGSLMNALLTNQFYNRCSNQYLILLVVLVGALLHLSMLIKTNLLFYIASPSIMILLFYYALIEFYKFELVPLATLEIFVLAYIIGALWNLQILTSKDQFFIKNAFSKYVPAKVVDDLIDNPKLLKFGGEERIVTIFFSDIENFTTISESLPPSRLVQLINEYLTEMTAIIFEHGGIIDKYIGDGILAEFGVPIFTESHANNAVQASLKMQQRLKELNIKWKSEEFPELNCRIGINTGRAVVGNMGSAQVFDYTVIGDAVNLAARLESANKSYGSKIMISEFVIPHLTKNKFQLRLLDRLVVKGKTTEVSVFEILDYNFDYTNENLTDYLSRYESGVKLLISKKYDESRLMLIDSLHYKHDDIAAKYLISKIDKYKDERREG